MYTANCEIVESDNASYVDDSRANSANAHTARAHAFSAASDLALRQILTASVGTFN